MTWCFFVCVFSTAPNSAARSNMSTVCRSWDGSFRWSMSIFQLASSGECFCVSVWLRQQARLPPTKTTLLIDEPWYLFCERGGACETCQPRAALKHLKACLVTRCGCVKCWNLSYHIFIVPEAKFVAHPGKKKHSVTITCHFSSVKSVVYWATAKSKKMN